MKKILLAAISGLVLLLAVVYGVGVALPVNHVATVRAQIPTSPDSVRAAVLDINAYPAWRSGVDRIDAFNGAGTQPVVGDQWAEAGATGGIPMELTESTPSRVVTTIVGDNLGFGGRWIFEFAPSGERTTASITEEGEVYSPVFRFVSKFVMGHHGTATTYLEDLGRRFGSEVEVEIIQ